MKLLQPQFQSGRAEGNNRDVYISQGPGYEIPYKSLHNLHIVIRGSRATASGPKNIGMCTNNEA